MFGQQVERRLNIIFEKTLCGVMHDSLYHQIVSAMALNFYDFGWTCTTFLFRRHLYIVEVSRRSACFGICLSCSTILSKLLHLFGNATDVMTK